MAAELVREWKTRTQLNIHESYGMTETAAMVTYNHYLRHGVGSVGTTVNITEAQIRDPQGAVLEQGAQGEKRSLLRLKFPRNSLFWRNSPN